jgi:N-acetylglucosaminyl-diphospho-decaprenol L-rhamnosyltransferase
MHAPLPTIGVIVVSYNTADLLRGCLASLAGCALPLRIVVVDNASPDASAALVRAEFPTAQLIALAHNAGYAGGTNVGLAALCLLEDAASGPRPPASDLRPPDHVLILNPDTVVKAGAIEALISFLEAHPRVGLVGPGLRNPDGSLQAAAFHFPTLTMAVLDLFPPGEALPGRLYNSWWHGRYPQEGGTAPFPIDHPLGACMLIRRAAIEQVGGMDEGYFMYSEEVDWCWRIRRAGWAIWQVPAAQVIHIGGAATRQFRWKMLVALYRSRARFLALHAPPWRRAAHAAIVRLGMLRLALLAWRDYADGGLPRAELRARLLAYGEVTRLAGDLAAAPG